MSTASALPMDSLDPVDRARLTIPWLVRLRWGAIVAQLVAVLASAQLGVALPVMTLLVTLAVGAATNVGLSLCPPAWRTRALVGAVLAFDTVWLSVVLGLSGGPVNPFSVLYLVQITLAAVVLDTRWTWSIVGLAILSYGLLYVLHLPVALFLRFGGSAFSAHLYGMWAAMAVAACVIAHFVGRVARTLAARERELRDARTRTVQAERLASLATLAAGAAHELATPLGTIQLAAGEILRTGALERAGAAVMDDARLISVEVARCRAVLDRLSAKSGEPAGEAPDRVSAAEIVSAARGRLGAGAERVSSETVADVELWAPRGLVAEAVANLLRNALDASVDGRPVQLAVRVDPPWARFVVSDEGVGMSTEQLARAGEPFFSTKGVGAGMGLGLFVARALAEQLGGKLQLTSKVGEGTRAEFVLPVASPEVRPHAV